jgi:aminoglycoside phosphotransferase family enzyme/predicted kinase
VNPDFLRGETWGFAGTEVEHIETHAAHVFLCGDRAFKVKKGVKLPYLDFSTVERRRAVLDHELAINRAFAPDIYLNITEKLGEPVLVMKRFSETSLLSNVLERRELDPALPADLAFTIADSHRKAQAKTMPGGDIMSALGAQLTAAFTDSPDIFPSSLAKQFNQLYRTLLQRLVPLLDHRAKQGLVRRCHGDLHCGNIVILDGRPVLFDAIEFSDRIATVDVLYDLAFLIMDLLRRDECQAANILLNRYLHLRRKEEDLSGLAALPLFLATRAGVRALVTADLAHELPKADAAAESHKALGYFKSCIAFLQSKVPQLVCIGGLSGTGKSTLAAKLAPSIGSPPGAIHVRSDTERKAMAGVADTYRLPRQHYSKENSGKVYEAAMRRAERALKAGMPVIIDAVFAGKVERDAGTQLAKSCDVPFHGFWLSAPAEVLKARVRARVRDASDATCDVVDAQLRYDLGSMKWALVDAARTIDEVYSQVVAQIK